MLLASAALAGPVKCCKLGADIKGWTGGYVYSGTLTNTATGGSVACTATTPCKCSDPSSFAQGCTLIKANTAGPNEAGVTCEDGNAPYYKTNSWGMVCLLNGIEVATNWTFIFLMVLVALFILWGAFNIVTAGGSPEKVGTGRSYIIYALVGLAVALLAKALPSIVQALLGV